VGSRTEYFPAIFERRLFLASPLLQSLVNARLRRRACLLAQGGIQPAHLDVSESAEGFTIRAEVPGFTAKELEINVDGRRLTISGKRETHEERKEKKTLYSERCSDHVLRVVDLPADISVDRAKATLKGGVLEFEVPKAVPAKEVPIATKAA
jgi:HSP20 family molecular chaperone IbpA